LIAIGLKPVIVIILLFLALSSDLKTCKIKNIVTYSFMLTGMIINYAEEGTGGLVFSLQGIALPAAGLLILYAMKTIGAGDIKLLSAVGSVMGPRFTLYSGACSFIFGGFIALGIVFKRKNGAKRFKYLFQYIRSCFLTMNLLRYEDSEDRQGEGKFRFSIAIASGTAVVFIIRRLGLIGI